MQHAVRADRPTKAYNIWIERIPQEYRTHVLAKPARGPIPVPDPFALGKLKHYRSLMPFAQEARKPMFFLKPADGAIGSHVLAVQDCYRDFERLARRIAEACGVDIPRGHGLAADPDAAV